MYGEKISLLINMFKKKNIFTKPKNEKNKSFKYFIAAFSLFIIILALFSVFMLMRSADFNFDYLKGATTSVQGDEAEITTQPTYSVSSLSGKSNILFICTDDEKDFDFAFTVFTDYDNKAMKVTYFNNDRIFNFRGENMTCANIYGKYMTAGFIEAINEQTGLVTDKYVRFTWSQLKSILKLFEEFSVDVKRPVSYNSSEFNLELDAGRQNLSYDLTYKYLSVSDGNERAEVICDIISSVLTSKYTDNSQKLFSEFVNLCDTDISVIDYSESVQRLSVYSRAEDKFIPEISN